MRTMRLGAFHGASRGVKLAVRAALAAAAACGVPALAQAAPPSTAAPADVPVTRVVLFTSGVGYFERSGTVTDTQELELPVAADQMDDLLQSLVVQDLDGGTVRPVRYPAQDPLARILQGYRLDLSADPTLAQLLAQARGEPVRVTAGQPIAGTIVNVEQVEVPSAEPVTYLTLATDAGLRRVSLAEVRAVQFEDPALQADLAAALRSIARRRAKDERTVRVRFEGQGTRRVRVGYVRQMPVWKTSYRLVVKADGTADLQGWAIVDNPTDTDLRDVTMAFVAGRPLTFVTGLYDPIYLPRPRLTLDFGQAVVPPAEAGQLAPEAKAANRAAAAQAPTSADAGLGAGAPSAEAPSAPQLSGAGVEAMAQGAQTGATFTYTVGQPVTVLRHESAMIPIVLAAVPAVRLSLYDPSVLADHPLQAVRLTNGTGLHLAAGPVTVYDSGGFTGDARIRDIVPGDSRVLSYAVDLGAAVSRTGANEPERVTAVTLQHGLLRASSKQRVRTSYRIDVRDGKARFVLIDHPKRSGFEVVSPSPAPAETPATYRFGVVVRATDGSLPATDAAVPSQLTCDAGMGCTLDVVMERTLSRSVALSNVSTDDIALYLANVELSAADRATLGQVLDLKRQLADVGRQIAGKQAQVDAIFQDQARIRQNMSALDRTSSLYQRYAADLEKQEKRLEELRGQITTLQTRRSALQDSLDALLASLGGG